jgi:hypothetical protein
MSVVEDKFLIQEIIHSYSIHLDMERIDVVTELFVEEGKLELRIGKAKGKTEITHLLQQILPHTQGKRHFITNTLIECNEDEAFAQSYLLVTEAIQSKETVLTGVYFDTFVKEAGKWKIHTRKLVVDLSN